MHGVRTYLVGLLLPFLIIHELFFINFNLRNFRKFSFSASLFDPFSLNLLFLQGVLFGLATAYFIKINLHILSV
jgi:hypothetical protein